MILRLALAFAVLLSIRGIVTADDEPAGETSNRRNILFFFMDDMGWKDLGCYGGKFIETPAADQLAKDGMRFTQAYASPVCSPTRASLISGQNAARHGIWEVIGLSDRPYAKMKSPPKPIVIPEEIETYADILGRKGYVCGLIGKWHAGRTPKDEGFTPYFRPITDPALAEYAEANSGHGVGPITARSLMFLRENKDKPFVLCVSHHAVHAPLRARDELVHKYNAKLRKTGLTDTHPTYAAMAEAADESLGILLAELDKLELTENTVVVFYSDNGGMIADMWLPEPTPLATTMLPLRDQKGSLYEGGIRVPLIVKWPGAVKPGSVSDEPVHSFDLFSTFLEIGGAKAPAGQTVDGISLVPLLKQQARTLDREALHWHFPTSMWTRNPHGAIRKGRYKLIEHYDSGAVELYDLANDIGETVNLAKDMPDKTAELLAEFQAWRKSVGAQMPTPNPNYDPARAHEFGYYKWLDSKPTKKH